MRKINECNKMRYFSGIPLTNLQPAAHTQANLLQKRGLGLTTHPFQQQQ